MNKNKSPGYFLESFILKFVNITKKDKMTKIGASDRNI